jgi:hypothetical protein
VFLSLSLSILSILVRGFAQQRLPAEPTLLRVTSVHVLNVPGFSSWDRTECDARGNLYFRPVSADSNYNTSAVLRLDAQSQSPTLYQLPTELASSTALVRFSVSDSGHVWFLNQRKNGSLVVFGFSLNGEFKSETKLETPKDLLPNRFIVAEDGIILVGGYFPKSVAKELQGKSYLGVFDSTGTSRKTFGAGTLSDVDLGASDKMVEEAVSSGKDGNFYYLQGNEIWVISEWGEVVRRISIQRPHTAPDVLRMDLSEGLISLEFYETDSDHVLRPTFLVIESSTGEPYGLYKPSEELGTVVVCFGRRSGYVFSRIEDGKIKLLSAALR